jgi:hypothetical protein
VKAPSQTIEFLQYALQIAFSEDEIPNRISACECVAKLTAVLPSLSVTEYLESATEFAISLLSESDPGRTVIALAEIAINPSFAEACRPVVFSALRSILEGRISESYVILAQVLETIPDPPTDFLISAVADLDHILECQLETEDESIIHVVNSLSAILEHLPEACHIEFGRIFSRVKDAFSSLISNFSYEETDRKLRLSFQTFLQKFLLHRTDLTTFEFLPRFIGFAIELLDVGIPEVQSQSFVFLAAIAESIPSIIKSEIPNLVSRAIEAVMSRPPHVARNGAYFIRILAPEDIAGIAREILQVVIDRLMVDELESMSVAYLRDTLVSAACVINGTFSMFPIDDFVNLIGRFLPVLYDTDEIGEVYSYLCRNYENVNEETQKIYFRCLVRFSCLQRVTADFIRRGVIELGVYLQMFTILTDCLRRCSDPDGVVNELLEGNAGKVADFHEFMAVLKQLSHQSNVGA